MNDRYREHARSHKEIRMAESQFPLSREATHHVFLIYARSLVLEGFR